MCKLVKEGDEYFMLSAGHLRCDFRHGRFAFIYLSTHSVMNKITAVTRRQTLKQELILV
jgi:hypothetical protein